MANVRKARNSDEAYALLWWLLRTYNGTSEIPVDPLPLEGKRAFQVIWSSRALQRYDAWLEG